MSNPCPTCVCSAASGATTRASCCWTGGTCGPRRRRPCRSGSAATSGPATGSPRRSSTSGASSQRRGRTTPTEGGRADLELFLFDFLNHLYFIYNHLFSLTIHLYKLIIQCKCVQFEKKRYNLKMIFILYIILIYFFKYNSHIDIVFLFDKLSTGLPSHHPVTAGHSVYRQRVGRR